MNILADFHQADLAWSLTLLAKRLRASLYFPYGISWFNERYFKLYEHPRKKDPAKWLAKQYLEDIYYDNDEFNSFYGAWKDTLERRNGCLDFPSFNTLTLEQARKTPIDIVICSVNENQQYFAKLKEFYPKAKFIRHVGNQLDTNIDEDLYPNLLASATAPYEKFTKNKVLYRQEFDLNIFKYRPIYNFNNIYSFQNDLEEDEEAWDMWLYLKHNLRAYNFKSFGVGNHDGKIFPKRTYVEKMLDSTFIFQRKFSEGFGHVVANALCLGRILVLNRETYEHGNINSSMLKDEETCLFMENTIEATAKKIDYWSEVSRAKMLSQNARQAFLNTVNFDEEFETKLKPFFDNLL